MLVWQGITLFTGSVRHLSLRLGKHWEAVDFTPLRSLTSLGTLDFDTTCFYSQVFLQLLPQLSSVTKLHPLNFRLDMNPALGESIARCSALKALNWANTRLSPRRSASMSTIFKRAQLTELAIIFCRNFPAELCCLTRLEHLSLGAELNDVCGLAEALSCMPNLQTLQVNLLAIGFRRRPHGVVRFKLSGDAFSSMDNLRSVSLRLVDIGESFFQELASRTGLTKLEFISHQDWRYSRDFLCQVNLLRNLEELTFRLSKKDKICNVLWPSHLPKLRRLNVNNVGGRAGAVRRKFERSMHPALINTKTSPWRSRFQA